MKRYIKLLSRYKMRLVLLGLVLGIVAGIYGCATTSPKERQASGAQLWAQDCQSCHNAPPSKDFSNSEWSVIIYHMRIKANITDQEAKKIEAFLKHQ
ncbi:MAG TPA: cytochrome c [Balneolaceae bacterium]|nr:cytochrome c [Balneolaceae bacterium]